MYSLKVCAHSEYFIVAALKNRSTIFLSIWSSLIRIKKKKQQTNKQKPHTKKPLLSLALHNGAGIKCVELSSKAGLL